MVQQTNTPQNPTQQPEQASLPSNVIDAADRFKQPTAEDSIAAADAAIATMAPETQAAITQAAKVGEATQPKPEAHSNEAQQTCRDKAAQAIARGLHTIFGPQAEAKTAEMLAKQSDATNATTADR